MFRSGKRRFLDFGAKHAGLSERNGYILDHLPSSPSWVLDIGSNLGDTANFLADHGHFVLGVERGAEENKEASRRAHSGAAFMHTSVSPDVLKSTVRWDAILLLSVLHRMYAYDGEEYVGRILQECAGKTDCLFIEGSTRHARYTDQGAAAPSFIDLDVDSAVSWHQQLFGRALGASWTVTFVKALECSEKEPYRVLFHTSR